MESNSNNIKTEPNRTNQLSNEKGFWFGLVLLIPIVFTCEENGKIRYQIIYLFGDRFAGSCESLSLKEHMQAERVKVKNEVRASFIKQSNDAKSKDK